MALDTFGKRIRALRQDQNMSQIELRDRMEKECGVNIGATYISELERKGITPSLEVAAAMARVLGVTLDYLGMLIDDATSYKREEDAVSYISAEADQVAQLVDSMSADQRAILVDLARNLAILDNERQRNKAAAISVLDSIERNMGADARKQALRIMRSQGLITDAASGNETGI